MALATTLMDAMGTLQRPTIGRDRAGGVTQDPYITLVVDEPCSVQQASSSTQALYAQRNIFVSTTVYLLRDIGAQVNDMFLTVDRTGASRKLQVQGVNQPIGRLRQPWQMDCVEVRPNAS